MDKLFIFIVVFLVIYLLYLFTVILNSKKRNKIFDTSQAKLIIVPNKLNVDKINKVVFAQILSLSNSFIVAVAFTISEFFDNYVFKLLVSFVVLVFLILFIYKLIGFYFKKREGK